MLERLVETRPELRIHLLVWDCNVLCAAGREPLQSVRLGWSTPDRVRFHPDREHRVGACHHEKIVVVDDSIAFVGGIDLTTRRWDTADHEARDSRRIDPSDDPYPPFHDVQAAVSGPIARRLGEVARQRWGRATGERLEPPSADGDPWPTGLRPDLERVEVGLARTDTAVEDETPVRDIERMYREALAAAERSVYVENQYLTSDAILRALCELLGRAEGPDVCILGPLRVSGWLEDTVMGRLRARVVERLREVDRHGRLRIWYPRESAGGEPVTVHSKVCVVDDRFATVGSANLSNRSFGLDSECNLFLDGSHDARVRAAIAALRNRLLAHHLRCDSSEISAAMETEGSLNRAVEQLLEGKRTLERLEVDPPGENEAALAAERLLDPERPLEWGELVRRFFAS